MRVLFVLALLSACASSNRRTDEKLDQVLARIQVLEERVEKLRVVNERLSAMLSAALGGEGGGGEAEEEPRRPDPATVFSVPIDGDAVKGPATAKVTIVEGAEFACPYCLRVRTTLAQIEKAYGKDVRFVWKNFVVHPQYATEAALAGCAAQQQGKFWEMENAIWEAVWDAETLEPKDVSGLQRDGLEKLAEKLKLDVKKYQADVASQACKDQIDRQERELARVGTRGTPAFYINGRYLSGAQPFEVFKRVIDEEIARADQALKSGMKPERYYESIVASGVKEFEP